MEGQIKRKADMYERMHSNRSDRSVPPSGRFSPARPYSAEASSSMSPGPWQGRATEMSASPGMTPSSPFGQGNSLYGEDGDSLALSGSIDMDLNEYKK